jgi:hemoglobin
VERGDLDHRGAIHDAVVHFYREIVLDDLLAPVFEEVAEVDWAEHIPKLIDYWCRVLLGERGYDGAILVAHRHVHDLDAFRVEHFDRWYGLWAASIDARWAGPYAEQAKRHAERIAGSLARQLLGTTWPAPGEGCQHPVAAAVEPAWRPPGATALRRERRALGPSGPPERHP